MASFGVSTRRPGDLALKLNFSMTCTGESETISGLHDIDNLALIKFKGNAKYSENKMKIFFSFSSSKHVLAKKKNIKINVDSKSLQYSAKNIDVPNAWSEWQEMGCTIPYVNDNPTLYYIHMSFVVTVYEDKKETVLSKLYTDSDFTDFHLATSEGHVHVHKAYLAAHSDVFKVMLTKEWKETTEGVIKMKGVTVETLQHLKDYMYLGKLPENGLRPLLLVARCYLIEDLEKQCIGMLVERVTGEDLFSLLEFACDNNIPELSYALVVTTQDDVLIEAKEFKKTVLESQKLK